MIIQELKNRFMIGFTDKAKAGKIDRESRANTRPALGFSGKAT